MQRVIFLIFIVLFSHGLQAQDQLSQNKVERLYQRGRDLITHSNYGAAREVFSEFLAQAPAHDTRRSEAEYYIAFSALNLGHRDGEKLIDQFIINYPSSPRAATAFYDLANFFYAEGNYTKASNYFKKVNFPSLTTEQQNEGHFKWGYSLFSQKKLDDALEQFNFVKRQRNEFSPAASYYAGFVESSKGVYDEALTDFKRAEESPAYANIVPYLIANIYYRQKRYDTVIEYVNSLKSRTNLNNAAELSMLVAESYYYKGDFKNAIDGYQKYFEKNSNADSGLLFRAGYANYVTGNTEKGVQYLDKAAASKDTVSYYASYYLGILYLKQGNKPLAINAFDYARKNPSDKTLAEESAFQVGKVSYDAGKPDQAINEFEKFVKTYPRSARTSEVKELLAQAYVNGNNYNKAIEYIEGLPSRNQLINQAYQKATYLKGSEMFNKELYADAITNFEKSLRYPIDQKYLALASFWNGEAYSIAGKFDVAAPHYTKVISLLPNLEPELLIKTRYALGYAFYNMKDYPKALFNFKDFTNRTDIHNSNYADGLVRLADCYYVGKQFSEALATYSKARTASTADADYILLQSGKIAGILKQYADSKKQFSDLITRYPKSQYRDDALFERAQFDMEQGNFTSAVEGLSQLIREEPASPYIASAYMRRALSNFNLKQYDRTINDYASVIDQFPSRPEAQEALPPLQEALSLAGRADEFSSFLGKIKKANPASGNIENLEYDAAKNFYFNQQYAKAVTSFRNYISSYPTTARLSEANYYLAESHYRLREFDKALPVYLDLQKDLTFPSASRVAARVAEIYFSQRRYDEAVTSFHRLEQLASNKKDQFTAWSGLMESFYLLAKYDSTEVYAREILENGGANAGVQNKASLYLGKAALARGDSETAKDEFLNTLNTAHDEYGAEAKYLLAEIFYKDKAYKQAYETLISLNSDFAAYENWVGKSFLLLADNYIAMDDVFNARATLQSLVDNFPLPQVKEEAKSKLQKLEIMELEKRLAIEADTLDN